MMKKILHLPILIALLLIFVFTMGCEREYEDYQQEKTIKQEAIYSHKIKPLTYFINDPFLKKKLIEVKKNRRNRKINNRAINDGFTIDTLSVYKMYRENYSSYTFKVTLNTPIKNTITSLVLEIADTISRARLIKVNRDDINTNITIKGEVLDITNQDLSGLTNRSFEECHQELTAIPHRCESGLHDVGESCEVNYTGFPSGYWYEWIEVCDDVSTPDLLNQESYGQIFLGLSSLGFGNFDDVLAFYDYLGWDESTPQLLWFTNTNNSYLSQIINALYSGNTEANVLNAFSLAMMTAGLNNNSFSNSLYTDILIYLNQHNNSVTACENAMNVLTFTSQNVGNPQAQAFGVQAIEATEGSIIDYEERIVLDSTFTSNIKALCVYNKLKESGGLRDNLRDYFDTNQTANLVFKLVPNLICNSSSNAFGCTSFNDNTQTATLTFDEGYIAQFQWNGTGGVYQTPLLMIAKAIIHESIHAQLFYNKYQITNGSSVSSLTFEELYEDYRDVQGWQHQFMANHHLGSIVNALGEVHTLLNDQPYMDYINNNYPNWTWNQIYENMAWGGLTGTPAGATYLSDPANETLYSLQNTNVAANSNEIHNCN